MDSTMTFQAFIRTNMEAVLSAWEDFARTLGPAADAMDGLALRDHARQMLLVIARDVASEQSEADRRSKSRGEAPAAEQDTAATTHGGLRFTSQFSIGQLAAEFRALRATVLRLRTRAGVPDAQDLVRFNEAIDQALAESIDAFSAKATLTRDLFVGVLGHDLRAPLATVGAAADVLIAFPPSASALQLGGSIKRATRHMAGMIENVINYARLQLGGGTTGQAAMIDLVALCNDAIVDARSAFPASEFELSSSGDVRGSFDPITLRQLVTNLFVNAAQHGDLGRPIAVALHADAQQVTLSVENHGRPIPEQELALLFGPMARPADADSTSRIGRTSLGLGLFIAEAVARAHGGEIGASSTPDGCTRFVVTLPVRG